MICLHNNSTFILTFAFTQGESHEAPENGRSVVVCEYVRGFDCVLFMVSFSNCRKIG